MLTCTPFLAEQGLFLAKLNSHGVKGPALPKFRARSDPSGMVTSPASATPPPPAAKPKSLETFRDKKDARKCAFMRALADANNESDTDIPLYLRPVNAHSRMKTKGESLASNPTPSAISRKRRGARISKEIEDYGCAVLASKMGRKQNCFPPK